jgi:MTH538 TIR-like domain (DUF1863)
MSSAPLSYWKAGQEDRETRIFISYRYDGDEALYDGVLAALTSQGHAIQDISLNKEDLLTGPRGGDRPKMEVQAEVAARIFTADLLIAPSRPAAGKSEWVTWEVALAAIGYGVPVLFVKEQDLTNNTWMVQEIRQLNLPHRVAERSTADIVRNAIDLIGGRPRWAVRQEEPDQTKRFRGPPQRVRDRVLAKFPYKPRLAAGPDAAPAGKGGLFGLFKGKPGGDADAPSS